MNSNRFHNRSSFFKHTTAETAKIILATRKLRWSAPNLFNDPFDVPSEIFDEIDERELQNAFIERINSLVVDPRLPHSEHHTNTTRFLLETFCRADPATKEEYILGNNELRNDPVFTSDTFSLLRRQWRTEYRDMRILCFTEMWDSASMWDRYSLGHTGILMEFACIDEVDSAWLIAKPVIYSDEPLKCNTVEGLAELMLYTPHYAVQLVLEEYTHTKTTDWAYEKEWRIASWKRPHESGEHSDYGFFREELIGVTFGASIVDADRREIESLIREHYPHVGIWQAQVNRGRRLGRTKKTIT